MLSVEAHNDDLIMSGKEAVRMAQHIDTTPEFFSECSKRYKEYSEQLEKMLAEMKCDREKLDLLFTGCDNQSDSFTEMLNGLSHCQYEFIMRSERLESVVESFLPEMKLLIPKEFY